jgi:hypothetical protein
MWVMESGSARTCISGGNGNGIGEWDSRVRLVLLKMDNHTNLSRGDVSLWILCVQASR